MANDASDISVNFGEAIVEGEVYEGQKPSQGFRKLSQDGHYQVKIVECEPTVSQEGNGVLRMTLEVLDADAAGTKVFANVTCTGFSKKEGHRPNIYSLFDLLLSAGRKKEDLDKFATSGKQLKLSKIAEGLLQDGKNLAVARIRSKIADQGKMMGKEVTETAGFTAPDVYAQAVKDGRTRWDKKIDATAATAFTGATSALNGAGSKISKEELDAASAGI